MEVGDFDASTFIPPVDDANLASIKIDGLIKMKIMAMLIARHI